MSTEKQTPLAPKARRDRLFVQDIGDELVIHDQNTRKTHRLNPTATLVWQACDGQTRVTEIAEAIRAKLGHAADENLVRVAVGELESARLLEHGLEQSTQEVRERRRAFLGKVGAVSLLMPVVATLPRPALSNALSPVGPGGSAARILGGSSGGAIYTSFQPIEPARMPSTATATLAGGCFWCLEPPYDRIAGVVSTVSGYMGGETRYPTYEQVSTGKTGHAEVVQIEYEPTRLGYATLLEVFWRNIDPTQRDGQFCEQGSQYRTAIFYHTELQRMVALASKAELEKTKPFKGDIVTEILPAAEFYRAEEQHQDFYRKSPARYKVYVSNCGRAARLKTLWGRTAV